MANARRRDLSGFRQAGLQDFGVSEGKSNLFSMSPHVHYAGSGSAMPGLSNTPFNDKLSYMAGNLEPRINNTLDTNNLFRPAREIVRDVNSLEGNKQPNSLPLKICSPSLSSTAETNITMANARKGDFSGFRQAGLQDFGVSEGKSNLFSMSPHVQYAGSGSAMPGLSNTPFNDKLSYMAGNLEPQVNNSLVTKIPFRPAREIVTDVNSLEGNKQPNSLPLKICSPSLSSTAEMNITMANAREPQKGDLIEFLHFGFEHLAVYVGDDNVIHLSPDVPHEGSGSSKAVLADTATVKKEKLSDVAGNFEPRINNCMDTKHPPRPADDIVRDAEQLVGTEQPYNLLESNCEHLVNELRYGKAESQQVQQLMDSAGALVVGAGVLGVAGKMLGPVGAAAVLLSAVLSGDTRKQNNNMNSD